MRISHGVITTLLNRLLMSKAIYKENCFSIYCNPCSISLKFYLEFCFLPLVFFCNKQILFGLAWFDIGHKNTRMCLPTDRLLLQFSLSLSSGLGTLTRFGSKRYGWRSAMTSSKQIRLPRKNILNKTSVCFKMAVFRCQILGFFGDKILGIEYNLEAETSVSTLA